MLPTSLLYGSLLACCVAWGPPASQGPVAQAAEPASSEPASEQGLEFFEARIRPVLVDHCYECHAAQSKSIKGGLRLDTRDTSRQGGDSGHAVVPGNVQESLLIGALRQEDFEMPPDGPLPERIIEDFETWIRMGAPDPREEIATNKSGDGNSVGGNSVGGNSEIDWDKGRTHWAFQSVRRPERPAVDDRQWPRQELDYFILARLESAGLQPVRMAEPADLVRRLYFDLIGMPPTPEQLQAFLADPSPGAYETLVDQLLDSPHFGEQWGRHWLDVARYAESMGKTRNVPFPAAWRYRDYVIDAFNHDKPYDRFLKEQIAGDLLPATSPQERDQLRVATGLLALGSHDLNERDRDVFQMSVVGEQIDVVSRAVMALTVGCARCHDHKFDPIPTADYYALAGIFRSSELMGGYQSRRGGNNYFAPDRYIQLDTISPEPPDGVSPIVLPAGGPAEIRRARQQVQQVQKRIDTFAQQVGNNPRKRQRLKAFRRQLEKKQEELQALIAKQRSERNRRENRPTLPENLAMGVVDGRRVADCSIHIRGDTKKLGPTVPRGFLQVISLEDAPSVPPDASGRLQLAEWLTRPDHPLTSRVLVNRVWLHLFGRGLVRTVDNFGVMGEPPSHPELLDHLASQFVRDGWSVKGLIRTIVLSRSYQLSSQFNAKNYEVDPDNVLHWRMSPRRLEAEAIRDAILIVSGDLRSERPYASPLRKLRLAQLGRREALDARLESFAHRSVYLPIVRGSLPNFLATFDFPESSEVKGQRDVTTVATQALFMMNNAWVRQQSLDAADRVLKHSSSTHERIRHAYWLALCREPTAAQIERIETYIRDQHRASPGRPERAIWGDILQSLIASAEFRYQR